MRTETNSKPSTLPWWRAGIFPLAMLIFLCGVGFLVQLQVAVELIGVAVDTVDRGSRQDAQTATTVLMALGASALLAGTMLWDRVHINATSRPPPRVMTRAAPVTRAGKSGPKSQVQRHRRAVSSY